MLLRTVALSTSLTVLGCYADRTAGLDAGLDAPRAAGDAPRDAFCERVRELPHACTARWARAWGTTPGEPHVVLRDAVALDDGGVALGPHVYGEVPLVIDGASLRGGGVVVLGPAGELSWLREGRAAGPAVAGGDVWWASRDGTLERASIATGATIGRTEAVVDPDVLSGACATCGAALLTAASWWDAIDLGPLGSLSGPRGVTLIGLAIEPAWSATVSVPSMPESGRIDVVAPRSSDATGGRIVGWVNYLGGPETGYELCPFPGAPCAEWPDGILVSYAADGTVRWTAAPEASIDAIDMLQGGGAVVSEFTGITRYAADGSVVWTRHFAEFTAPLAVDEDRERVWAAISVPAGRILEIGGVRAGDCPTAAPFTTRWPTLLVELDLGTGEALRARLPVEELMIRAIDVLPDGGVVIAGDVEGPSSVEACGARIERADDPDGPIDVVVVALD